MPCFAKVMIIKIASIVLYFIVCVYMCTVLLPTGGYPIAVKYIISYHIIPYQYALTSIQLTNRHQGGLLPCFAKVMIIKIVS